MFETRLESFPSSVNKLIALWKSWLIFNTSLNLILLTEEYRIGFRELLDSECRDLECQDLECQDLESVRSAATKRIALIPVVTNAIWWFWCTTLTTTWEMHDRVRFPISLSNLKCYGRRLNSYAPNFLWSVIVGGFDSSNDHKKLGA